MKKESVLNKNIATIVTSLAILYIAWISYEVLSLSKNQAVIIVKQEISEANQKRIEFKVDAINPILQELSEKANSNHP